ncbi:MAG: hypothetical protein ABEI06_01790 [Halobacteriaceae archaeon]
MEKTPSGTSVGVDDPYEYVGVCDHLTDDGRCRYAFDYYQNDPEFATERQKNDFACPVIKGDWEWSDCPHFRSRATNRECFRCGLTERRDAHSDARPLLEEHHLSYSDPKDMKHEITVYLCRWCHGKVHKSWARLSDDVNPDPEALAELESRRSQEQAELTFETAAERRSFDTLEEDNDE